MFLRKARIELQLGLIVGAIVIGFVPMWGLSRWQEHTIHQASERQNNARSIRDSVEDIRYNFLNARRREKDFFLRLNEKEVSHHATITEEILSDFKALEAKLDQEQAANAASATEKFKTYNTKFQSIVEMWKTVGLKETEGLRGDLEKRAIAAGSETTIKTSASLMARYLDLRRLEKDVMLYSRQGDIEEFRKDAADLLTATNNSAIIADWLKLFDQYVSVSATLAKETSSLSKLFAEAEPFLNALIEKARNDVAAARAAQDETMATSQLISSITMMVILTVVVCITIIVALSISRPLAQMTTAMEKISGGNLSVDIPAVGWKNAIGQMAAALVVFRDNALEVKRLNAMAESNRVRTDSERRAMMEKLAEEFQTTAGAMVETMVSMISQIGDQIRSVANDAKMVLERADASSRSAGSASHNVEAVAAATEELTASIGAISEQVERSAGLAHKASDSARITIQRVESLSTAAVRIGEVVSMITAIADQTNLLALNATIEAARAGEAGKGFAVVANEVKGLATQTGRATEEIVRQVGAVQAATEEAVQAINAIAGNVHNINDNIAAISTAVSEQGAATREISNNVINAVSATSEVSDNIREVASLANTTSKATHTLDGTIIDLRSKASALQDSVTQFLGYVRGDK
ncbi:HAMP domain-containing protein [Haematospirillum jordaniae]|uniref:methyl-accepting chemotaxis protein n=1 Tax=Haematospirillum jordaniae TaxID=1549855 RepID=UPI0014329915|nr:methyl-accepting chemotaxis protein [Haematospirillum jordaniae]NKD85193.1 HAMP domain-containing protein [Haematospirillum jordaniae]